MSTFFKSQGFTLLEALIALVLLSIIVLGSGTVLNWMMKSQNDVYINSIIVNEMQKRLQKVNTTTSVTTPDLCSYVDTTAFTSSGLTFYMACEVKTSTTPVNVSWPVMAASKDSQANATSCASAVKNGTSPSSDCYIVGN